MEMHCEIIKINWAQENPFKLSIHDVLLALKMGWALPGEGMVMKEAEQDGFLLVTDRSQYTAESLKKDGNFQGRLLTK